MEQNRYNFEDLLTTADLMQMFGRTELTILNWRKAGMPYINIPGTKRATIRFDRKSVMEWTQRNGKRPRVIEVQRDLSATA